MNDIRRAEERSVFRRPSHMDYTHLYQGSLTATLGINFFVPRAAARQPGAPTKAH